MTDNKSDPPVYGDDGTVKPCNHLSPDQKPESDATVDYRCGLRENHIGVHRALDGDDRPLGIQWPRTPVEGM